MTAILWSDVLAVPGAIGDGMAQVPALGQTMILAVVNSTKRLDVDMFDGEDGPITKLARCFLALHMAARGKVGAGGALIGEADGRLSRQYAMPTMTRSSLTSTSYGTAFWELIGPKAFGPRLL